MAWEKDDAWSNKKAGARRPRGRGRHAKADAPDGSASTWETSRKKAEKRQKRRRVSWILGALTLVVVLLVMLAPTIGGALAPGMIARAASDAIAGRVEVDSVSFSWFGEQRVRGLRLYDDDNERRGELAVTADKGLLALAFSGGDYGTITLSGELDASENDKGEPFTAHTVGPAPGAAPAGAAPAAPPAPPAIPANLRVTLALDDLSIRYARPAHAGPIEAVRLENLAGTVRVDASGESVVDLGARVERRRRGEAGFERAGSLSLDATATNLADADGVLTPDDLAFDATVNAIDIGTDAAELFADLLPPAEGGLAEALGRTVTLNAAAEGTAGRFTATIDINSDALRAHAPLAIDLDAGLVSTTEPLSARLDTERLSRFLPDRDALIGAGAPVAVTAFPAVSLTLDSLRAPIPGPGAPMDLSAAGGRLVAEIGRLAADLNDQAPGAPRAVGFEPATVTLDATDLARPATLTTALRTVIDGNRSGTLAVDLAATGLVGDDGAFNTADLPALAGTVRAEALALPALQPLAMALGFDLVGTLGDTADLTIEARPGDDASTTILIDGAAPHAQVAGTLAYSAGTVRTLADPLTLRLARPDAAIAPALGRAGIGITGASGLTVTLTGLAVEADRLGRGDLSTLALDLSTTIDRLDAVVEETGERVSIENASAGVRTTALAQGLRATASNRFTLAGRPAGRIDADLTAADLLGADGAFKPGLPSNLRGTVTLGGVRTDALGAFVPIAALDLPTDLGPTLDATAALEPTSGDRTRVALSLTSQNLNGTGSIAIGADGVTGGADALSLELTSVGPLLERLANTPEGPVAISATTPGRVSLRAADLALPLDPAAIASAGRATLSVTLADLALAGPGGPAGTVRSLGATAALTPGNDPAITLNGTLLSRHAGGVLTGVVDGTVTLANAFAPPDEHGRTALAPNGEIRARDIPVTFARLLGIVFPGAGDGPGLPLDRALSDAVGTAASVTVGLSRDAGDADAPFGFTLDTDAGPHTLDATAAVSQSTDGAFGLTDLGADARVALDSGTVRTILAAASPGVPGRPAAASPGALTLTLRNDRGTLRADATIDPTTIDGLEAPPARDAAPSARPRPLDPITLAGSAGATLPLALLNDPGGAHAVSFNTDLSGTDAGGRPAVSLIASGRATLADGRPGGDANAEVRVSSRQTAWVDAVAGQDGLLAAALGERFQIRADLTAAFPTPAPNSEPDAGPGAPMPTTAAASLTIDAPALRTASPASFTLDDGTLRLAEPLRAAWTVTPELFARLAPPQPGKAAQVTLAAPADVAIAADRLVLPLSGARTTPDFALTADATELPMRFSDGTTYRLTDLALRLASMPEAGTGKLVLTASTEDADADAGTPVALDATVSGLPRPGAAFDPAAIALDGVATIDALPMRLIDAIAGADGALVALLGPALDAEATVRDLPQPDGGLAFRATTDQAAARYGALVREHPAHPGTLALIINRPATAEITHFDYDFSGKRVAMLPVFGKVEKIEKTHRPASVNISQLITPVDGDVAKIKMRASVDPGVIRYEFDRGLAALLKAARQRTESAAGERLQPFEVTMADGVARFDKLAVPVGEFTMTCRGTLDLVRRREDITLGIPAGAFAGEVIGDLPGATGGLLNPEIVVPVRRRGPMDRENPWEPDFEAVLQQLFSPENILKNIFEGGLKDLIKDGGGG
jgi:hypothetical protein